MNSQIVRALACCACFLIQQAIGADDSIEYGRRLVERTFAWIGPEVARSEMRFAGNSLACQNCHLVGGTRSSGLSLTGAFGKYPRYLARDGKMATLEDRINGCLERSMNGRPLPKDTPEMRAFIAYLKFIFETEGEKPTLSKISTLARAADPERGREIYGVLCSTCHGAVGEGHRKGEKGDASGYEVPPLWGDDSFNDGAGLARLMTAAAFIHANMPYGPATPTTPVVTEEEAWDVAAYVDSRHRPHKSELDRDYPNLAEKPFDAPYGPWTGEQSPLIHRFGPFPPSRN